MTFLYQFVEEYNFIYMYRITNNKTLILIMTVCKI